MGEGVFEVSWIQILVRYRRCTYLYSRKTGGINVIDLANINSAPLSPQDLGKKINNSFEVLGRFDNLMFEVAGCF
jgi:hypothetical protein